MSNDLNKSNVELEVKNLKKYYKAGGKQVLKAVDDVSFTIYKGETLGIVGAVSYTHLDVYKRQTWS